MRDYKGNFEDYKETERELTYEFVWLPGANVKSCILSIYMNHESNRSPSFWRPINRVHKQKNSLSLNPVMYKRQRAQGGFRPPRPLSDQGKPTLSPVKRKIPTDTQDTTESTSQSTASHSILQENTQERSQGPDTDKVKKYIVQWRKVTSKKNKTWDGDGTITINGSQITAKIDNKSIKKDLPKIDGIFKIGQYELEIDCEVATVVNVDPIQKPMKANYKPVTFKKTMPHLKPKVTVDKKVLYPINDDSFVMKKCSETEFPVVVDPKLNKVLRPHQREGISFMYEGVMGHKFDGNGVLVADEMGLGKTLMTITLLWTLLHQSPLMTERSAIGKALIVCPVTLINNWKREFKKWLNLDQLGVLVIDGSDSKLMIRNFNKSRSYQVMIMSYERLLSCEEEMQDLKFDLLICDEGHKLKNNTNKSLKILNNLDIPKKILLSGTPIQNNLTEFFTLINFLNPGILGNFNTFQRKFIKPIERSRDVNCFNQEIIDIGKEASEELSNITKQFVLRRTNEILFKYLNSKTDVLLFVKPTSPQLKIFSAVSSTVSFVDEYDKANVLNLINVFKKICNSPSLLSDDTLFKSLITQRMELPVMSGKLSLVIKLLIEFVGHKKEKVVIVSNYTKTLDVLEGVIKKLNYSYLRLDGSTNSSTRTAVINQFNNLAFPQFPIFLLSSKSGGFGINLIGASRLILFDNDWNPSNDLQSMSRIYRDGQTKPVYIYRVFTTGCIDEKIFQRQLMKNNLSDKFLDNSSSNLNVFDTTELKDLFTVNADTNCGTHDLVECGCEGDGASQGDTTEPDIIEEAPSESPVKAFQLGYISALSFSELDQKEVKNKASIKNALSYYKHHDPSSSGFSTADDVINNVVKTDQSSVSYVFTKVSNPDTLHLTDDTSA